MLRMDHKGTKVGAGRPGRSYNNSPGRTDGSLDQGGGRGGGNKWPDSGYMLRVEPKGLTDGNLLALAHLWASGCVRHSDLCFL